MFGSKLLIKVGLPQAAQLRIFLNKKSEVFHFLEGLVDTYRRKNKHPTRFKPRTKDTLLRDSALKAQHPDEFKSTTSTALGVHFTVML